MASTQKNCAVKKPYSVLLLYPDYMANNYGEETYYSFVSALCPEHAVEMAQRKAFLENGKDGCNYFEDFLPILVIEGHHKSIAI